MGRKLGMGEEQSKRLRKFSEDEIVIREGENWDFCYKVISGKVVLYKNYGTDKEYLVSIISDQHYLGEVGFLTDTASQYTIVCMTDVLLMAVSKAEFEQFIERNAKNAIDLMKHMASSIITLNRHIDLINDELEQREVAAKPIPIDVREKLQEYKRWSSITKL